MEKYVFTHFVSTFVFYGLLIFGTEVVELISIIYEYQFERKGEVKDHKYKFLLERKDYIKEIINKINKNDNDKVSNIIKQYFSNYIQMVLSILMCIKNHLKLLNFIKTTHYTVPVQ